jgi:tetratricopeptide (TPR) repeat protein
MQMQATQNAQDPANREEKLKQKKDRFTWWQTLLLLVATLVICLSVGYFISQKYFWNQNDQLTKQFNYYKTQVDKKPNDANLRVQLGYSYFLKGDSAEAINQYKLAIGLDKNNFAAYLNAAIAYDKLNQNDDALQMEIKAAKLSPEDYEPLLLEGRSYRKIKMYKQATKALQDAIRFKPGNTDILNEVGLVAEAQGKKAEAEKIYKEALSYDPTYKPALDALNRLNSKNK